MKISGVFKLDREEKIKLDGNYEIQSIVNEELDKVEDFIEQQNIECQQIFVISNVLVRTNTEGIENLIKTFIRYTHDPCEDLDLDFSIKKDKQMRWGTICPTRKVLFIYKDKIFVAYGRYIFGYDHNCVCITKKGVKSSYKKVDDRNLLKYKITDGNKITEREIALCFPDWESHEHASPYTNAFLIYDKHTQIVDAFGIYS